MSYSDDSNGVNGVDIEGNGVSHTALDALLASLPDAQDDGSDCRGADDAELEREDNWSELLQLGPEAFARALQQAESDLEKGRAAPIGEHPSLDQPNALGGAAPPASVASVAADVHASAFREWAQRISRLQILDLDDEARDDPGSTVRLPEHVESAAPQQLAALALSHTALTPEAQLLRFKLLLAQEEAKSVHLEDRVLRLEHALESSRKECTALRQTNESLSARVLAKNVAHSNGGAIANANGSSSGGGGGSGMLQLEVGNLRAQNKTLKRTVASMEKQMASLLAQLEQAVQQQQQQQLLHAPARSPSVPSTPQQPQQQSFDTPSGSHHHAYPHHHHTASGTLMLSPQHPRRLPAYSPSTGGGGTPAAAAPPAPPLASMDSSSSFSAASRSVWASSPLSNALLQSPSSASASDATGGGHGHMSKEDAARAVALLRVRTCLALARITLRHQAEVDHLLQFKMQFLGLQTRYDDLEEVLEAEREAHARTSDELRAHNVRAQQIAVEVAQQLHRKGQSMSLNMSPATSPHQAPVDIDNGAADASAFSSIVGARPGLVVSTPQKGRSGSFSSLQQQQQPQYAGTGNSTPNVVTATVGDVGMAASSSGGGGGGWAWGSLFGSNASKTARKAAKEQEKVAQAQQPFQ